MKSKLQIDDFIERFFKMENEYSLFSLRTRNEYPLWDIIRDRVAAELKKGVQPNFNKININKKFSRFISNLKISKNLVLSLFNIFKPLNENIFFLTSRNKTDVGTYFDISADGALSTFNKSQITIIETNTPHGDYKYSDYDMILCSTIFLFRCLRYEKMNISPEVLEEINNALKNSFPENSIPLLLIIQQELFYFQFSFRFYYWLLRKNRKRLKRVFVTQNGIQKGLFLAAHHVGIKCYEFQHGIVDKSHTVYSYNSQIYYETNDLINPNIFFTFSKYWSDLLYHPFTLTIPSGNDFFSRRIEQACDRIAITVISSIIHDVELRPYTIEFSKKHPEQKIYYKLHPSQFWQADGIKKCFFEFRNIVVIRDEESVLQLLAKSKVILAVASTAVYEALHNNISVILLKRLNFMAHHDIFNHPKVNLVNDLNDFEKIISGDLNFKTSNKNIFFHPFQRDLFMNTIE
jgi:hypothetical protein